MKGWMLIVVWVFIVLGWWSHYYRPEWMTREVTDGGEGVFYEASPATSYPKSDYIDYLAYSSGIASTVSATTFDYIGSYDYTIRIPGNANVDIQVRPP